MNIVIVMLRAKRIINVILIILSCSNKWKDNIPPSRIEKGTKGGLAISFSACADDQLAIDTTVSTYA